MPKETDGLVYAVQTRLSPRRLLFRFAIVMASLLACITGVLYAFYRYNVSDRDGIRHVLESIPGARDVEINGYEDGPSFDIVEVRMNLDPAGRRRIWFGNTTPHYLVSGEHLRVLRIGDFTFETWDRDSGQCFDFGRDGGFANLLPFKLKDAADLAAHYDDVHDILKKMPRSGTHRTPDGRSIQFEIKGVP